MNDFEGVEDTLFIPLAGRVFASKNYKEFFYDEKALELEKYIPSDAINEATDEYFSMASLSRFYEFDNLVKEFIKKHEICNVICLGAGLETMYFRIKPSQKTIFYEVDFPDVIKQRKIVLGEQDNERLIGCDILDYKWMDQIDKNLPTIFIVSGVFQYLYHEDVAKLILAIKNRFNEAEIAFDATNKTGLKKANEYVEKTGNNDAAMHFYLNDIKGFVKETQSTLIKIVPFYKNATRILKRKLKRSTRFLCFFGDRLGFTKIIYLKLN